MESGHITHDFPPFFRVHNTGRIERYIQNDFVPPSHDPQTGVVSKDVHISLANNLSARIYLPQTTLDNRKLPLLVYIHGGAFSIGSAFSSTYHNYVNTLAARSSSVVVSVEYRLAPEHPIPACYDDTHAVLEWVGLHSQTGSGPDPWLREHADFNRIYLAGDSAGASIAHNMVVRGGLGIRYLGLILIHPYFGSGKPDALWNFICSDTTGDDDVRVNPASDMGTMSGLGCDRVLVCVAERDFLRKRGLYYYQSLRRSGWKGEIELFESPEEEHVFHLFDSVSDSAVSLMERIVGFVNGGSLRAEHLEEKKPWNTITYKKVQVNGERGTYSVGILNEFEVPSMGFGLAEMEAGQMGSWTGRSGLLTC